MKNSSQDNIPLFKRHADADAKIESALTVIKALLSLDILLPMKRRFLSKCLWSFTAAEGKNKYDLRFRSQESLSTSHKQWRHDHVYRRKMMVDALLERPVDAERIVSKAVGCVVTIAEHKKLGQVDRSHPHIDGWERYRKAGIVVLDMTTGAPKDLDVRG